jgi:hypothetical protein
VSKYGCIRIWEGGISRVVYIWVKLDARKDKKIGNRNEE